MIHSLSSETFDPHSAKDSIKTISKTHPTLQNLTKSLVGSQTFSGPKRSNISSKNVDLSDFKHQKC